MNIILFNKKNILPLLTILTTIILSCYLYYLYSLNILDSVESIQLYIEGKGSYGIILFIVLQIIQVVLPVIPGGLVTVAGVLIFGSFKGFILNYIGNVLGSIILFHLVRYFGKPLVDFVVSKNIRKKYYNYINSIKFYKIFAWAIFLPFAPDDSLVAIAGISKMTNKFFYTVILLGKPMAILCYSMVMYWGMESIINIF